MSSDYVAPVERQKPTFALRQEFTLRISKGMGELLLQVFDDCVRNRIMLPKEVYAFYRQMETLLGYTQDDEVDPPKRHRE